MKQWYVYLLQCSTDNSLYCGVTTEIETRLRRHNSGKASKYTRSRLPVFVVCVSDPMSKTRAMQLEYRIKKLPRSEKLTTLQKYQTKEQGAQ